MRVAAILLAALCGCRASSPEPAPAPSASGAHALHRGLAAARRALRAARPTADTRSEADKAQAACAGADGWHCPALKRRLRTSGPQVGPGYYPPSQTVTDWYVGGNCASDSNSGTAATCTSSGIGPLAHIAEKYRRWGAYSPRLRQHTTNHVQASQSDDTDPWYVEPLTEISAYEEIVGTPTVTCGPVALTIVSAKNRSTGQLLVGSAGSCFTGPDLLVQNLTRASFAWTKALVSGHSYSLSEPANNTTYVSVDWQANDSVQVVSLPQINVRSLGARGGGDGFGLQLWVHDVVLWAPHSLNDVLPVTGGIVYMDEVQVQGGELYANSAISLECDNCDFPSGTEVNSPTSLNESASTYLWGIMQGGFTKLANATLGGDLILGGTADGFHYVAGAHIGSVYVDTGAVLVGRGADSDFTSNFEGLPSGTTTVWGPGQVEPYGSVTMTFPSSAAAVFLNTGGLTCASGTSACAIDTTVDPAVWHCNRSLTPALIDTAVSSGGFGECAICPGGARICKP